MEKIVLFIAATSIIIGILISILSFIYEGNLFLMRAPSVFYLLSFVIFAFYLIKHRGKG